MNIPPFSITMNSICTSFIDNFTTKFNSTSDAGLCTSDKIIRQDMTLYIGRDFTGPTCTINATQTIDTTSTNLCMDINKRLVNTPSTVKQKLIKETLDQIIGTLSIGITQNVAFINALRSKMTNILMNVSDNIQANCSQNIFVGQDQKIYLLGKVECENSTLDFTQKAIVKQYMKCMVQPVLDVLLEDPELKSLYELNPNRDCEFVREPFEGCNGSVRKFKIKILSKSKGSGTCKYNQTLSTPIIEEEKCEIQTCKVSEWSDWSECLNNTQSRNRYILSGGVDCSSLVEERVCETPVVYRELSTGSKTIKQQKSLQPSPFYNMFIYGPSILPSTQRYTLYLFIGLLIIACIYSLM